MARIGDLHPACGGYRERDQKVAARSLQALRKSCADRLRPPPAKTYSRSPTSDGLGGITTLELGVEAVMPDRSASVVARRSK